MNRLSCCIILSLFTVLDLAATFPARAQDSADKAPQPGADVQAGFEVLKGSWVRPDGGYTITITNVTSSGVIEATYANPSRLPFSKAEASRDGKTLKLFFELEAGGYNGSTYTLEYDPARDVLTGVYYQANARQKFDIYFGHVKK